VELYRDTQGRFWDVWYSQDDGCYVAATDIPGMDDSPCVTAPSVTEVKRKADQWPK
jgi:hypothetical protein